MATLSRLVLQAAFLTTLGPASTAAALTLRAAGTRSLVWRSPVANVIASTSFSLPENPSFEDCIDAAPYFCRQLQESDCDSADCRSLATFIGSANGARGFFVNWLTNDEYTAAEQTPPPMPLLQALNTVCSAPPPTSFIARLMLMNVAMPAATALVHRRSGNEVAAQNSERTRLRASLLASFIINSGADNDQALPKTLAKEKAGLLERHELGRSAAHHTRVDVRKSPRIQ
mmetsp:Transcript_39894/g.83680  ORF Transcript_39894/g.83680 Transcript_39894/m.83680 type:complete len:230 (-) Transcript_39894:292-981(-)